MANKEITPDTWGEYPQDMDGETVPNKERGCGYMKAGSAYVRMDPRAFSTDGVLPAFVILADDSGSLDPIPYKESLPRGYETIAGTSFATAAEGGSRNFRAIWAGSEQNAFGNMVDAGAYPDLDSVPESEIQRHIDFLAIEGLDGTHWGEMPLANHKDLMMRAGKSYYDDPWDFIDEAVEQGLNKGISVHDNKRPPTIVPGRTRCWIIHPHACGEDMPGVVGFSYLTRTIFTRDKDGKVPEYIQNYSDAGQVDIVNVGEPEPREEDEDRDYDDIAEKHQSLDDFDPVNLDEPGEESTFTGRLSDSPETVQSSGSTSEAVSTAISSTLEPGELDVDELEKADLKALEGAGWIDAESPPAEASAHLGNGKVMALVHQAGELRKITGTNPGHVDVAELADEAQNADTAIRTGLGPYIVTATSLEGVVLQVKVESR